MKKSKKLKAKLAGRIADWKNTIDGKRSDIVRKHPNGFRQPGSNK